MPSQTLHVLSVYLLYKPPHQNPKGDFEISFCRMPADAVGTLLPVIKDFLKNLWQMQKYLRVPDRKMLRETQEMTGNPFGLG